jgi:hypothetical protein
MATLFLDDLLGFLGLLYDKLELDANEFELPQFLLALLLELRPEQGDGLA